MQDPVGSRAQVGFLWWILTSDLGRFEAKQPTAENTTHLRRTQHWLWISMGVLSAWILAMVALSDALLEVLDP